MKTNTSGIMSASGTDRFIVKYKSGTKARSATSEVQSRLDKLDSSFPARAHHSRRMGIGADVVITDRRLKGIEANAFMRAIASDPDVEYVEPDVEVSAQSTGLASPPPNDPFYNLQWGLFSNLDVGQTDVGIRLAGASAMASGAGIAIGLVDNGITSHSDLNDNVIPAGYDFTYLGPPGGMNPGVDGGGRIITYHGTHVAGIMAAAAQNGIGIAGVAPSAKIVSARVLNQWGTGLLSSASDAVIWASGGSVPGITTNPNPVSVINTSLAAAGTCSRTFQEAIDVAISHGVIVVTSAGNDDGDASNAQPANCHGVITVGNTRRDGSRASDSNYGPVIDIAAPGTDIYSTYNAGETSLGAESYAYLSGTSMASPMVSGVVALVQSVAPKTLSAAEMRTLITQNAQPFPKGLDQPLGSGILDATATVTAAKSGVIPAAADFTCSQSGSGMNVTCTDLSTARGKASIRSWAWNFDSGNSADLTYTLSTNPTHQYGFPGTYKVSLTTTDSTGAVSTLTLPVVVNAPATIDINANQSYTINAKANVPQYYKLQLPDGMSYTNINFASLYTSESGTMYVRTDALSNANMCTQTFSRDAGGGGGAACYFWNNPKGGAYYIILIPDTDISNAQMAASYVLK